MWAATMDRTCGRWSATYRHTDLGRAVFELLSRFSFWTTVFDRTGAEMGHS
jgi:hypothetical protein